MASPTPFTAPLDDRCPCFQQVELKREKIRVSAGDSASLFPDSVEETQTDASWAASRSRLEGATEQGVLGNPLGPHNQGTFSNIFIRNEGDV